ncbi:MAG: hypothetical protein PVI26_12920, partial [Chitinispirillia bacterium]
MKITRKEHCCFFICIISCLSALFVYFPLTNTDIWWHMAAAREMILTKGILYTDPFAYSIDNPQWIDLHWFSQILFLSVFSLFSGAGLLFFKCFVVFLICLILSFSNNSKKCAFLTGIIFSMLIFEMRMLVLVRPILLTILYMSIYIWSLEHYLAQRDKRYLYMLIPIQILWTNSQGLFILGPIIAGCYVFGEWIQRFVDGKGLKQSIRADVKNIFPVSLVTALGFLVLSCLVNPYGFSGFLFPFKLFKRIEPGIENIYSHNISENI